MEKINRLIPATAQPPMRVSERVAWYALLASVALLPLTTSITRGAIGSTHSITADAFHAPKLLLLAMLAFAATGAWITDLILGGRALRVGKTQAPLAIFAVLATASTLFALEPLSSLFGANGLMTGLITWLLCIWMSLLMSQYLTSTARMRELSWVLVAGTTLVAIIALLQALGADVLGIPHSPEQAWMVSGGMATLGNPNYTALLLVVPALVALGLFLSELATAKRRVAGASVVLLGAATFVTLTRAAWLGLTVGVVVFVGMTLASSDETRARLRVLGAASLGVMLLALLLAGPGLVSTRLTSITQGLDSFSSGRITLWGDVVRVVGNYPVFGTGADRLALGAYEVQTEVVTEGIRRFVPQDPHNLILLVAGVFGIPALIALLAYVGMVLAAGWRGQRAMSERDAAHKTYAGWIAGLVGLLVASVLSVYTISGVFVLFISLGVVAAPSLRPANRRTWLAAVAAFLGVGIVLTALYGAVVNFDASRHLALSRIGNSAFHYTEAMRLTPWDAKTRTDYLWAKTGSLRSTLTGDDADLARAAATGMDAEIKLAIVEFPRELLLYRMRIALFGLMEGYPGYQPDMMRQAIDDALSAFPDDVEFNELSRNASEAVPAQ